MIVSLWNLRHNYSKLLYIVNTILMLALNSKLVILGQNSYFQEEVHHSCVMCVCESVLTIVFLPRTCDFTIIESDTNVYFYFK